MVNNNKTTTDDNRQLTDVFKELQQTRLQYEQKANKKTYKKNKKLSYINRKKAITISSILTILILVITFIFITANSISAQNESITLYSPLSKNNKENISIEINRHRLNAHNIINSNSSIETIKKQEIEEKEIPFETLYTERSILPKDEQIIIQKGENGKKNVTFIRTYTNNELKEEMILKEEKTLDFLPQIVDIGTSEFLYKIKSHLKDTLYLKETSTLYENQDTKSNIIAEIPKYLDVKLLDLPNEQWCKVSYDGIEGFLSTENLTSSKINSSLPEKCRITKILLKVNENMPLNQSSGLTLEDYKKIFTNLSSDIDNVFFDNYEVFYNMDKKYNINGIFLASVAIHESNWGTSQISKDKKNLFGYGSYDETPYDSSYEFETYKDSIELVAKSMVKYYLNPPGTKIYDEEYALATYYNGPTVSNVNIRYASDPTWSEKVYQYMEMLYNRIDFNY